jgi:hypothetical protein
MISGFVFKMRWIDTVASLNLNKVVLLTNRSLLWHHETLGVDFCFLDGGHDSRLTELQEILTAHVATCRESGFINNYDIILQAQSIAMNLLC